MKYRYPLLTAALLAGTGVGITAHAGGLYPYGAAPQRTMQVPDSVERAFIGAFDREAPRIGPAPHRHYQGEAALATPRYAQAPSRAQRPGTRPVVLARAESSAASAHPPLAVMPAVATQSHEGESTPAQKKSPGVVPVVGTSMLASAEMPAGEVASEDDDKSSDSTSESATQASAPTVAINWQMVPIKVARAKTSAPSKSDSGPTADFGPAPDNAVASINKTTPADRGGYGTGDAAGQPKRAPATQFPGDNYSLPFQTSFQSITGPTETRPTHAERVENPSHEEDVTGHGHTAEWGQSEPWRYKSMINDGSIIRENINGIGPGESMSITEYLAELVVINVKNVGIKEVVEAIAPAGWTVEESLPPGYLDNEVVTRLTAERPRGEIMAIIEKKAKVRINPYTIQNLIVISEQ